MDAAPDLFVGGQEGVLVDAAVVGVEGGEHDHVGEVGAEAL